MKISILMLFILCIAFGFHMPNDVKQEIISSEQTEPIDTGIVDAKNQYAYIISIEKEKGITYAVVDYIEFLVGKKAFEAARRHGDLDTSYDDQGHMHVSVDNDIYIVNDNKKLRKIPLALNVVVVRVSFETGNLNYVTS